jgi:hypothetical protein
MANREKSWDRQLANYRSSRVLRGASSEPVPFLHCLSAYTSRKVEEMNTHMVLQGTAIRQAHQLGGDTGSARGYYPAFGEA